MFKRLFGICLTFGMAATAPPLLAAHSNTANCAAREEVVQGLRATFSEELTMGGLQSSRDTTSILEIWASDETGTFTVLVTSASGISCIVAAGTDFFRARPEVPIPEGTAS